MFSIVIWRRKWQPTPVFLPRESCGRRSLMGCCPQGCTELDTIEATQHVCMHLEKEMVTCSSALAWRIPGPEEPGGTEVTQQQQQYSYIYLVSHNLCICARKSLRTMATRSLKIVDNYTFNSPGSIKVIIGAQCMLII